MRHVLLAVVRTDGEDHAVLADDLGEPGAEVEPYAVLAVQFGEELSQLRADDVVKRCRPRLDDGDLGAVPAGGGGDLQTDPAAAGDDEMAVVAAEGGEDVAQPVGVGEPAQMVDAGEVGAGDVETARFGAGGQEQFVVAHGGAVAEVDAAGVAVDPGDRLAEVELHVVPGVPGGLVDEDAVAFLLTEEEALGQRGRS